METTSAGTTSKISSAVAEGFFGYYPGAVAVITSRWQDEVNVMSAGWHTALSEDPPLYGVAVAPERHSHRLILNSGRIGVNFLPFAAAEAIAGAGLLSGSEMDKFERLGLTWQPGPVSGVPILNKAYLTYECEVVNSVETGDHTFFVAEVKQLHYLQEAFADRLQDSRAVPSVAYYGRSTYEELGRGDRKFLPPALYREVGQ